ncbi:MAG: hypothetical protein J3R72DRAFT_434179 [Linnemannia gamsii]|nr:MAG: hypothetical protein J3R72DRAFT_434179 [Linnemannia gamsii]
MHHRDGSPCLAQRTDKQGGALTVVIFIILHVILNLSNDDQDGGIGRVWLVKGFDLAGDIHVVVVVLFNVGDTGVLLLNHD